MEIPFRISFANGLSATVVAVSVNVDLEILVQEMGLTCDRPVLVVVGGASKMSEADFGRVQDLFMTVLAPLAQKWQAIVIDGGTDAGIMRLMGQAREAIGGTFPLVGVIPIDLAILPGQANGTADAADLEPHHTHFVLVPGATWGDESAWIANLATTLTHTANSVTVLINGGEVAWKDATKSVAAARSLIAIAGSGRTADVLAAALNGHIKDDRAQEIVASGLLQAIDLEAETDTLTNMIEAIFTTNPITSVPFDNRQ